MSASDDDLTRNIQDLLDRARTFGEERAEKFQHAMDLLKDLFGLTNEADDDKS